jgi:hypothetical protein
MAVVREVLFVDPPGDGEVAVHPARRRAAMQITESISTGLSIQGNFHVEDN